MASHTERKLWRDRSYPSHHVTALPRLLCGLFIDYAAEDQLPACRQMVLDSAQRGDNIGLDDYEFNESLDLDYLLVVSEVFVAVRPETKKPEAYLIIQPCLYSRTWDTCWASIHVIYSAELHKADVDSYNRQLSDPVGEAGQQLSMFGKLLQLGLEFANSLQLGYTDALTCVADCCSHRAKTARQLGFLVIATIPDGVDMAGIGFCSDLLFAQKISQTERPRRPLSEIHAYVDRILAMTQAEVIYSDTQLPTIPFLPQRYFFANGLSVIVRSMTKQEDHLLYEMMKSAADSGRGYGVDEFPTLSAFRLSALMTSYTFVFEDESNGEIVGGVIMSDAWFSRTRKSGQFETNLILSERYRGRGIGGEAVAIELSVAVELGYRAMLNDHNSRNSAMKHLRRKWFGPREVVVGCLMRGLYVVGSDASSDGGWDDQVICWQDISNFPTFTEIAERSRKRALKTAAKL